jgi:choline dehydrogenase
LGIGPSDVLKSLDIPVKIDLPDVGYNLQDHPMIYANYYCEYLASIRYRILMVSGRNESYLRSDEITDDVYDEVAEEYIRNRTGERKYLREGPVSDKFRSLDGTSHKHGCVPKSTVSD